MLVSAKVDRKSFASAASRAAQDDSVSWQAGSGRRARVALFYSIPYDQPRAMFLSRFQTLTGTRPFEHIVCVAITGSSAADLFARAAVALADHPLVELRLDSAFSQPANAIEPPTVCTLVKDLVRDHPDALLVATCRRTAAGGQFHGNLADELAVILAAAEGGCALADLALESADELGLERVTDLKAKLHAHGAALMVSYHDYHETSDLHGSLARLERYHPDAVKLVSTANHLADSLAMLRLLREPHPLPIVGIAMGEAGVPSRVLGPGAGGLFTFGSVKDTAGTAPGQMPATELRELYRLGQISASTRVYGVAGQPISHSLSPLMQNTAFSAAELNAVFLPLATGSAEDLFRFARELPPHGMSGLSVTMPLKQTILPWLDWVDPLAARVGACNTVVRTAEGALHGYNTDVGGVIGPLESRLDLRDARVLVVGAGGAARAAVFGLRERDADVSILNRTEATAAALAEQSGARLANPAQLRGLNFDVLVNATPFGQLTGAEQPLCARLVFDMVYSPLETPLLRQARAEGLRTIPGYEMFLEQGARQFELWAGRPAPREQMRDVVLAALRARERPAGANT